MKYWLRAVVLVGLLASVGIIESQAQGKKHVIQLSGIILGEDSVTGLPGVHVYVPKAGRGTTTNRVGYFSMPVLIGDSVVFSSVGYERQSYIVPKTYEDNLTLVIDLVTDTTYLDDITIMPFPTEEVLKEAILALNLPLEEKGISNDNLNQELLDLMMRTTPMDGYGNFRFIMDAQRQHEQNKFGPPPNPLLNPFNWARFLRDLKRNRNR
ncbi:MAG: carboxypeptidase-like regulatory domain-containing protein [Candidatus Cyclobacteriaceae bacterium M2_1C_046]